jgi:hypothetical protein
MEDRGAGMLAFIADGTKVAASRRPGSITATNRRGGYAREATRPVVSEAVLLVDWMVIGERQGDGQVRSTVECADGC